MIGPRGAPASTTLAAWNVRGYRPRTQEVEKLFTNSATDVLFLSETMQGRRKDGTVDPLEFEGQIISIPGVREHSAGHPSMGVAFLAKRTRLKRIASLQGKTKKWQMLVVETDRLRLIGVYAKPKMPRPDWVELLARLESYKANSRPTVVSGDLNAIYSAWSDGTANPGGEALRKHLRLGPTRGEPPSSQTPAQYNLHAPAHPTCIRKTTKGVTQSTLDLFIVSRRGNYRISNASLLLPLGVGGSDHAPIALSLTHPPHVDTRPATQFLPTPTRLSNPKKIATAQAYYSSTLPQFSDRFAKCTNSIQLADVYADFVAVTQKPWTCKAARKPARYREGWTRATDALAKQRTRATRRLHKKNMTTEEKKQAWVSVNKLNKQIQRQVKKDKHAAREETQRNLRDAAEKRSVEDVAAVLRKRCRDTADADLMGGSLNPADFTRYFADKPDPPHPVALRHFFLQPSMREKLEKAIQQMKRGKAPGPDGIPADIYKIAPSLFATAFFYIFQACGRLAATIPGWDLSILIPIPKRGALELPQNHRPLRLINTIKKIFGLAIAGIVKREAPNNIAQFGFQEQTSALDALVLVVAHLRTPHLHTIAVDQAGAYDSVCRTYLMTLVDRKHTAHTAALISMMLQPATVYTQGDVTKTRRTLNVGLTQGGNESPDLFNIMADDLLAEIVRALIDSIQKADPSPAKAFADDLLLQLRTLLNAKRALLACERWETRTGQRFTMKEGKSAVLQQPGDAVELGLQVNNKTILPATSFEYLGITITATGPTEDSIRRRCQSASIALQSLRALHILVRGMNIRHARMIYDTFIVSKWSYACFLQPLSEGTLMRLNGLDAGFLSAVTATVRTREKGNRRAALPIMRAIARLPSPQHRRQVLAHSYAARLIRIIRDPKAPSTSRIRAQNAHRALEQIPAFLVLVPNPHSPWKAEHIRAAREKEWARASQLLSRPVPPPGRGRTYYPPAMRLQDAWARNLAMRYHCNTFPILHRALPRAGPRPLRGRRLKPITEVAMLTTGERDALATLKKLLNADCTNNALAAITAALSTLRPRDTWARSTRN